MIVRKIVRVWLRSAPRFPVALRKIGVSLHIFQSPPYDILKTDSPLLITFYFNLCEAHCIAIVYLCEAH